MIDCSLRLGLKTDLPFIYNSWLKSYSENNADVRRMGDRVYFAHYKKVIERIFDGSAIVIACNPEDSSQIYGYAVADLDQPKLHYVYVKYPFRKLGICRKILKNVHPDLGREDSPLKCTFANKNYDILKKKYNLTYNPFER